MIWLIAHMWCAQVRSAQEINVTGIAWVPSTGVGTIFTQNGLNAIVRHERRHVAVYQMAYNYYLEPIQLQGSAATRCGRVCRPEPGEAEILLRSYLDGLRAAGIAAYLAWEDDANEVIEREYKDVNNLVFLNDLFHGFRRITRMTADLAPFYLANHPQCPSPQP